MGLGSGSDRQSSAEQLTQERSLDRLETFDKYLFSIVSVVGTLLVGFGLYRASAGAGLRSLALLIPVALVCLSLGFAVLALVPRLKKLNIRSQSAIEELYSSLIVRRGRYTLTAGLLFAAGLFAVPLTLVVASWARGPVSQVALSLNGSSLEAVVELERLPRASTADTTIQGYSTAGTPEVLFKDVRTPDLEQKVSITTRLDRVQPYSRFLVQTRIRSGDRILYQAESELTRAAPAGG